MPPRISDSPVSAPATSARATATSIDPAAPRVDVADHTRWPAHVERGELEVVGRVGVEHDPADRAVRSDVVELEVGGRREAVAEPEVEQRRAPLPCPS